MQGCAVTGSAETATKNSKHVESALKAGHDRNKGYTAKASERAGEHTHIDTFHN
jgi:hypothetical protein